MSTALNKKKIDINILISAAMAGIIFIVFCLIKGIAPLGDNTILRNDGIAQYAPFLAEYIAKIKGGASLVYSWNLGGGTNQFALICYYLLSPFNLLALPFGASNIDIAMFVIILVKTMCIAASFCFYISRKFEKNDITTVAFSLIFTFSGFYLAYYYNTMWLDALIALPFVALGIENIVNGKKSTLYFLALAYTIFVNFYIGYMVCIFAVLYFFYLLFAKDVSRNSAEKAEDELPIMQVMTKFGVASLFAGLICFFVILPVLYAISNSSSRADFDTKDALFNFFDFLSYHITGVFTGSIEKTTDTLPHVMSSMLTFLTVPAFFCLKKIKPNKKVATAVVLVIFYFSFSIPKMNYFWHGFSAPNLLPYRFSFLYLFFLITLAYEAFLSVKEIPAWSFGISAVLAAVALIYTKHSAFSTHFDKKAIIVSTVAVCAYMIILLLAKYDKLKLKTAYSVIAVLLVAEIITGSYTDIQANQNYSELYKYEKIAKQLNKYADNEKGITRVEIIDNDKETKTYPALYNYNGMSVFSSLTDTNFAISQMTLGNIGNYQNSYKYVAQTPFYNALMSMQYVCDTVGSIDENSPYYEKVADIEGGTIYKVKYSLPLGYCISDEIMKWDPYNYVSTSVQNLLWKYIFDTDDLLLNIIKDPIISYDNCHAVDYKEVTQYVKDKLEESSPDIADHDHDHNHDHESENADSGTLIHDDELYEGAITIDLSAESIAELLKIIGDIYHFKATQDDFSVTFEYTADESGEIFALVNSGSMQTLTVKHEDGTKKEMNIADRHISDLGYFEKGERYTLTVSNPDRPLSAYEAEYPLTDSIQLSIASVNEERFVEGYNKILENGVLDVKEFDDTYIYGTVKAKADCVMMMPMPYDEGWTVYVDGEPVELLEQESHIMMFRLSAGEHEVEMSYFPLGLREGIFVSVAAVLGLVMVLLLSRVHKMKMELVAQEEAKKKEEPDENGKDKE